MDYHGLPLKAQISNFHWMELFRRTLGSYGLGNIEDGAADVTGAPRLPPWIAPRRT